jgi:hypothetical protein
VFLFFKTRELQQVGARDRKEINMDITAPKKKKNHHAEAGGPHRQKSPKQSTSSFLWVRLIKTNKTIV